MHPPPQPWLLGFERSSWVVQDLRKLIRSPLRLEWSKRRLACHPDWPQIASRTVIELSEQPGILTEGLTKHYGDVRALNNLDLEVRKGEVFGFLGPNGAGKTTMIRTILDLIRPTSGRSWINGLDSSPRCRRDSQPTSDICRPIWRCTPI